MATKVDVNELMERCKKIMEEQNNSIEKIEINLGIMMEHLEDEVCKESKFSDDIKTLIFEKIDNAKKEFQTRIKSE